MIGCSKRGDAGWRRLVHDRQRRDEMMHVLMFGCTSLASRMRWSGDWWKKTDEVLAWICAIAGVWCAAWKLARTPQHHFGEVTTQLRTCTGTPRWSPTHTWRATRTTPQRSAVKRRSQTLTWALACRRRRRRFGGTALAMCRTLRDLGSVREVDGDVETKPAGDGSLRGGDGLVPDGTV